MLTLCFYNVVLFLDQVLAIDLNLRIKIRINKPLLFTLLVIDTFCIPEILNTNIWSQIFEYKITYVFAQHASVLKLKSFLEFWRILIQLRNKSEFNKYAFKATQHEFIFYRFYSYTNLMLKLWRHRFLHKFKGYWINSRGCVIIILNFQPSDITAYILVGLSFLRITFALVSIYI